MEAKMNDGNIFIMEIFEANLHIDENYLVLMIYESILNIDD